MNLRFLRDALRFDGLWWRKFAYLGSVYGPEWWKRGSPRFIAAVIFLLVKRNRRGAVANVRRVRGSHGRWRDHRHALQTFVAFAESYNEALEHLGPRPQPVAVDVDPADADDRARAALARGQGLIFVTCHFGNWDVAARAMTRFDRPLNLVMAREANETTDEFTRRSREDSGVRILLSDSSVFSPFNMLRALRRNEVVCMQLDRPLGGEGARAVEFFGAPALFQSGPIRLARLSGAPVFPMFVLRLGPRRYRLVIGAERHVPRAAGLEEMDAVLASIVAEFEALVRAHPEQWFQFAPFWPADVPALAAYARDAAAAQVATLAPRPRRAADR